MSYCRFSCDYHDSEVYVYDCGSGIVIHIAGVKLKHKYPGRRRETQGLNDWLECYRLARDWLSRDAEWVDIDHPEAGEIYRELPIENAIKKLKQLKDDGFHIPDHAIEGLEWDLKNERN